MWLLPVFRGTFSNIQHSFDLAVTRFVFSVLWRIPQPFFLPILALKVQTKMAHLTHEVIVLLIIIGCIASVFIGYGLYALAMGLEHDSDGYRNPSNEQAQYMREVRGRNLGVLAFESRRVRQGNGGDDDIV